jgi:MFS family permease
MPAFPVYADSRGASLAVVGVIIASYGFIQFLLRIPVGYLSDRHGSRLIFIVIGLLANALGSVGMALFPSPALLIVWRGIHGVGAASWVVTAVYFASFFRPDQAGRATGLLLCMTALAQVAVSMAGGILAENFGMPFTFWASSLIALIGVAAIFLVGERSSFAGRPMSLRRFSRIISSPSLAAASGIAALAHFVTFGLNIAFIPIFADALGASKTDLGTVTTVSYLAFALASLVGIVGGRKFGQRSFVVVGSMATTLTILALPAVHAVPALVVLQAINGFARGMVFPVLMGIAISEVPEYERASAMGVFQAVYAIGMFAGPTVAGLVADRLGMNGLFFFIAGFPILGLVVALGWLPPRPVTFRVRA